MKALDCFPKEKRAKCPLVSSLKIDSSVWTEQRAEKLKFRYIHTRQLYLSITVDCIFFVSDFLLLFHTYLHLWFIPILSTQVADAFQPHITILQKSIAIELGSSYFFELTRTQMLALLVQAIRKYLRSFCAMLNSVSTLNSLLPRIF